MSRTPHADSLIKPFVLLSILGLILFGTTYYNRATESLDEVIIRTLSEDGALREGLMSYQTVTGLNQPDLALSVLPQSIDEREQLIENLRFAHFIIPSDDRTAVLDYLKAENEFYQSLQNLSTSFEVADALDQNFSLLSSQQIRDVDASAEAASLRERLQQLVDATPAKIDTFMVKHHALIKQEENLYQCLKDKLNFRRYYNTQDFTSLRDYLERRMRSLGTIPSPN